MHMILVSMIEAETIVSMFKMLGDLDDEYLRVRNWDHG